MLLVNCTIALYPPPPPPPPRPWGDVGVFWGVGWYPCCFQWQPGSVTLIYSNRRKKRMRKSCVPGAVKGGGGQNWKINCRRWSRRLCHPQLNRGVSREARGGVKGRFKDFITPPLDNITDLSCKLALTRWQILPEEMGKINIGLVLITLRRRLQDAGAKVTSGQVRVVNVHIQSKLLSQAQVHRFFCLGQDAGAKPYQST